MQVSIYKNDSNGLFGAPHVKPIPTGASLHNAYLVKTLAVWGHLVPVVMV